MACITFNSEPVVPIELLGFVLAIACRATINDDPAFAATLQLVSRTAHAWLLPVVYEVLVVGTTITRPLTFLQRLITEQPSPSVRQHIRHLVLTANPHIYGDIVTAQSPSIEWHLQSVAVCAADAPDLFTVIQRLSLRPRRIFIDSSGKFYGVLLGCLVQQQSRDAPDHRPIFQEFRDHLEEVHTACVVRSDIEEQALGDEFTLEDVCGELDVAVRDSAVRPYRPNQLRITMDIHTLDAVPNAIRLILSILRCPGVSLTLVLPLIPPRNSSEPGHTDIPAWKLCGLLSKEKSLAIDSLEYNLKIVFSPEEERPRTVLEYATAVRSGHSLDMPGQRLEELGVGDL